MFAKTQATDPAELCVSFAEKATLECITTCLVEKKSIKDGGLS